MRSLLVTSAIGLLVSGLLTSPFVHAHIHSNHDHEVGRYGTGIAVHAHLPETDRDSRSERDPSFEEDGRAELIDLFVLRLEKSAPLLSVVSNSIVYSSPVFSVIRTVAREDHTHTRDPASTASASRAPPLGHVV